jgi:hypothetical protein
LTSFKHDPLAAKSGPPRMDGLSRSLDTILYGEITMFMVFNGGRRRPVSPSVFTEKTPDHTACFGGGPGPAPFHLGV